MQNVALDAKSWEGMCTGQCLVPNVWGGNRYRGDNIYPMCEMREGDVLLATMPQQWLRQSLAQMPPGATWTTQ